MNVNPTTGTIAAASSNNLQRTTARIQSNINSLVSGNRINNASDDISGLAIAIQLQSRVGELRAAGNNISRASSAVQVANQSIDRQIQIVDRLKQLSVQANSGSLDDASRKALDSEFQSLTKEITRIAENTRFGNASLLDGSFKTSIEQSLGNDTGPAGDLLIPDLSAASLFGNTRPSIATAAGAQAATDLLNEVSIALSQAKSEIGAFSQALDYASANLLSAAFNQEAARSELSDADFAGDATQFFQLNTQQNLQTALLAQSNRLNSGVLSLLNQDNS